MLEINCLEDITALRESVDVECKLDGPGQRLSMASMQAAQMCLSQHSSAALALQQ